MPLTELRHVGRTARLGLWRMSETPASLVQQHPSLQPLLAQVAAISRCETRQMERLAVHALLEQMTGQRGLAICHEADGRPVLDGFRLSISHTRGYAVLLLSREERVAVDIEWRSDRVRRIAQRFIRPDEQATTVEQMLALWSAKETVFKLFPDDRLWYDQMQATEMADDRMVIRNLRRNELVPVRLEWTEDYVLTFAVLPETGH